MFTDYVFQFTFCPFMEFICVHIVMGTVKLHYDDDDHCCAERNAITYYWSQSKLFSLNRHHLFVLLFLQLNSQAYVYY